MTALNPVPGQTGERPPAANGSLLALVFAAMVAVFYLYTYNSGFGYDGSEYLVIGRSLLDGFRMSAFVVSKGWASYLMAAAALAPAQSHAWVAAIITALFALAVLGTWATGRTLFGAPAATLAAALVAVCAVFMEMNFLLGEIPVYLCALAAIAILRPGTARRLALRSFAAGCCLGLGFGFKAVVVFYAGGLGLHLLFTEKRLPFGDRLRSAIWLSAGFAAMLLLPAAYFAATGQLDHHILWSFAFPMLYFPANTYWLSKLYTKLLWFFLLLGVSAALAATRPVRDKLFANPSTWLVLWMGTLALGSLLKSQASHYAFSGAAFLSMFIAETLHCWWSLRGKGRRLPLWIPVTAAVLMSLSAYLYRPAAFRRFLQMRDYSGDEQIGARLVHYVPEGGRALFLQGSVTYYWLAHRYPNVPLVDTDVQSRYVLERQPDLLEKALDDPNLKLVAFDPEHPEYDDPRFVESPRLRAAMDRFGQRLRERFTEVNDAAVPAKLWVPKTAAISQAGPQ